MNKTINRKKIRKITFMKQRLVAHPKYGLMLEKEHEFYFKKNKRTDK